MIIAIFTETYTPCKNGVATSTNQLKLGLEQKGHTVYVFCTKIVGMTDPFKKDDTVYKYLTIRLIKADFGFLLYYPSHSIEKTVNKIKPDIIHIHTEFLLGYIAKKVAQKLHIPFVLTNHTMYDNYAHYWGVFSKLIVPLLYKYEKHFLHDVEHVIYPSVKPMQRYYSLIKKNSDYKIIPNAIDKSDFMRGFSVVRLQEIKRKLNITEENRVILYSGRLSIEKNTLNLVINLKDLLAKNKNHMLVLVGSGKEKNAIEAYSKKQNIQKQVILTGGIPWSEMCLYYHLADVFVTLSLSESTCTMTIMEAMSSGLPIVTINDVFYKDVITNGHNGYKIDNMSEVGIYAEKIIANKTVLEQFKKNALLFSECFSFEKYINSIESYYIEIIDQHKLSKNQTIH